MLKKVSLPFASLSLVSLSSAQITGGPVTADNFAQLIVGVLNAVTVFPIDSISTGIYFLAIVAGFYFPAKFFVSKIFQMVDKALHDSDGLSRSYMTDSDSVPIGTKGFAFAVAFVSANSFAIFFGVSSLIIFGVVGLVLVALGYLGIFRSLSDSDYFDRDPAQQAVNETLDQIEQEEDETERMEHEVEDLEQDAEEDLDQGDDESADQEATMAAEELEQVADLLQDEIGKIDEVLDIEESQLEDSMDLAREARERREEAIQLIEEADEQIGDILYQSMTISDTDIDFEASESHIEREKMYRKEPEKLREDLLEQERFSIQTDLDLRKVGEELERAREIISTDVRVDQVSLGEAEQVLQESKRTLEDFRQLKQDIEEAAGEEQELETIIHHIGDEQLWEQHGKQLEEEMQQIIQRFRSAKEKEEALEELERQVEQMRDGEGEIEIFAGLMQKIEKLEQVIEIIEESLERNSGNNTTLTVPPWERDRLGKEEVRVELWKDQDAETLMRFFFDAAEILKNDFNSFDGVLEEIPDVKMTDIPYTRTERRKARKSAIKFEGQRREQQIIWNPGLTQHSEDTPLVILDESLKDRPPAFLATICHEMMHVCFDPYRNFSHLEIHQKAMKFLIDLIQNYQQVTSKMDMPSIVNRQMLIQAYGFAAASESLFPKE